MQTFRASVVGGFVFRMGIGALPFLVPLMLQLGFGLTPFASGMITFAGAAGAMTMKLTAAPILRWLGFRSVLLVNTVVCAVFMASYGFFGPTTPHLRDHRDAAGRRLLPLAPVHEPEHARLRGDRRALDEPRDDARLASAQQLSLTFGVGLGALLLHATLLWTARAALGPRDFGPAFFAIAAISLALALLLPAAAARRGRGDQRARGGERGGRERDARLGLSLQSQLRRGV